MTRKHLLLPALLIIAIAIVVIVRGAPTVSKTEAPPDLIPSLNVAPTALTDSRPYPEAPTKAPVGSDPAKDKEEILSKAYDQLESRLHAARLQIGNRLAGMNPAQGLAYLQTLMALPAPLSGPTLEGDRLRRVVAAEFFPKVARLEAGLGPAVLSVVLKYAAAEADPVVRRVLVGDLGGIAFDPSVVLLKGRNGNPPTLVENLSPDDLPSSTKSWHSSLRTLAASDPDALELLGRMASTSKDSSSLTALRSLAGLDSAAAGRILASLWISNPDSRSSFDESAAAGLRPELLDAFVRTLPGENRPLVISSMCRAIEASQTPPAGSAAAVLEALNRLAATPAAESGSAKGRLLAAAARLYPQADGPGLRDCLTGALEAAGADQRALGYLALAAHPSADFTSALRTAALQDANSYNRELAGYALRKTDASNQDPNLLWDLEQLKKELSVKEKEAQQERKGVRTGQPARSPDPALETLRQQVTVKEDQLQALRRR